VAVAEGPYQNRVAEEGGSCDRPHVWDHHYPVERYLNGASCLVYHFPGVDPHFPGFGLHFRGLEYGMEAGESW